MSQKAENENESVANWQPEGPFNALPIPPPQGDLETKAILIPPAIARALSRRGRRRDTGPCTRRSSR
jgi:hypothetical protein